MRRFIFGLTGALATVRAREPARLRQRGGVQREPPGQHRRSGDRRVPGLACHLGHPARPRHSRRLRRGPAILVAEAKGLIIPAIGFNPSPDFLARVVCHDAAGALPRRRGPRLPRSPEQGDGTLVDVVELPAACFAPIVLITGSTDPAGNRPGNWFAVSGPSRWRPCNPGWSRRVRNRSGARRRT